MFMVLWVALSAGESTTLKKSWRQISIFFELNEKRQIINHEQVKVFERIRDLGFKDNQLYLFMENTASIGIIDLN